MPIRNVGSEIPINDTAWKTFARALSRLSTTDSGILDRTPLATADDYAFWKRVPPSGRLILQKFALGGYHRTGRVIAFADDRGFVLTANNPRSGTHYDALNVFLGGSILLTTALILLFAILLGARWGLTFATAIVFMQMAPNLFTPVQRLISSYTMYQSLVPGIVSTYELFDTKPTVVERPGATALGEVHGDIDFENVVFGYSARQRVLDGISFHIKEGETIAFVGPIGCGKSTILNLILRFLDPQQGQILLEGKDISGVTLNSLREQVSKLSQFPFFLKDTIRENVRLGRAEASDAAVEQACNLAHIHDVIVDPQRMPQGYNTIVDVQVPSGGQKRLIALARCLLRKPEVLLLDEPTENLDADQRNRLIQVIREYANERTCLVISHDLNFVAAVADRILVIDKGKIVDQGAHDELISREGLYKTLYGLKNVDPSLLRTRNDRAAAAQPGLPGGALPGMDMPGAGGMNMPPGMSMGI